MRPAYHAALRAHDERDPRDPDAASAPDPFVEVAVARQTRAITMEQYVALGERLGQLSLNTP